MASSAPANNPMESMHTFLYPDLQDLSEDLSILGGGDKPPRTSRTASEPPEYSGTRRCLIEELPDKAAVERMQRRTQPNTVSYDNPDTPSMYIKECQT
jgi:hypothetical protein